MWVRFFLILFFLLSSILACISFTPIRRRSYSSNTSKTFSRWNRTRNYNFVVRCSRFAMCSSLATSRWNTSNSSTAHATTRLSKSALLLRAYARIWLMWIWIWIWIWVDWLIRLTFGSIHHGLSLIFYFINYWISKSFYFSSFFFLLTFSSLKASKCCATRRKRNWLWRNSVRNSISPTPRLWRA